MAVDPSTTMILGASLLAGLYMAWNIGANDVANSMSTAVGAKAITHKQAVVIAGVLTLIGATFVGGHVTDTIRKGIVDPGTVDNVNYLLYGLLAVILASGFWVTIATWKELPISTTHSIVGAMIGFGFVVGGSGTVNWSKVGEVALSWVISPLAGCALAYIIFRLIVKVIFSAEDPVATTGKIAPFILWAMFFIIFSSFFLKTPLGSDLFGGRTFQALELAGGMAACIGVAGHFMVSDLIRKLSRRIHDPIEVVEKVFMRFQVITSCYVAFSHGANDVANAMGPVAVIWEVARTSQVNTQVGVPIYLLALGGIGITVGIMTWGYKVIKTIAYKITKLTHTRGFSVDFGAATTVLTASKLGMPISTTHTVVGAVIGVGLARGLQGIDLRVIKGIVVSWLVTLPIAAFTSAALFIVFKAVFI